MNITEKLIDIVAKEFKIDPNTLTPDTNLLYDLELDSMDLVYLWYEIEASFKVLISDDFQITTIENFSNYLKSVGVDDEKIGNPKSDSSIVETWTKDWINTSSSFTL